RLLFDSLSHIEKANLIEVLLKFPVSSNTSDSVPALPEPFSLLKMTLKSTDVIRYRLNKGTVANLMKFARKTDVQRTNALHRLITLYTISLLSPSQTKTFVRSLWSVTDNYGLPAYTEYTKSSFIYLPSPPDVNPEALFKKYILAYEP